MNKYIIILSLLAATNKSFTQSFSYFDSLTYKLYNEKKWDSLIIVGNKALEKGYDYYYMQMRIGIANYELKKYSQALTYFLKAKQYNSNDIVDEYIYYSYFFDGQTRQAYYFSKNMSNNLLKKLHLTKPKFIDNIGFDVNYAIFNNWNNEKKYNSPPSQPNNYILIKDITGPFVSYSYNVNFNISKGLSWSNQISYFKIYSYQQLFYDNTIKHEYDYYLYENHYYTSLTIWSKKQSINIYSHINSLKSSKYKYEFVNVVNPLPPNPNVLTYNFKISPINEKLFNYTFGFVHSINFKKTNYYYAFNLSKIIDSTYIIGSTGLKYPLNSFIYGITGINLGINTNNYERKYYIEQSINVTFKNTTSLYISYITGKIKNFTNTYGNIIYNTPYTITSKLIIQLNIPINRHIYVSLGYVYQKSYYTNVFNGFNGIDNRGNVKFSNFYKNYDLNNQIIIGGILWKL
jgi:hypothetical protein